jgi:hypothetical protein
MAVEPAATLNSSEAAIEPTRTQSKRARRTFWQVFGIPIVLGLVSTVGLIAALVGNGLYDAVSWIALTIPVIVILKYLR